MNVLNVIFYLVKIILITRILNDKKRLFGNFLLKYVILNYSS